MDDRQVQAMVDAVEAWRTKINQDMSDMKLRQWCVERAIELHQDARDRVPPEAFIRLCESIMKFVSAPFEDVFKDKAEQ
jgi:hypothetical protein